MGIFGKSDLERLNEKYSPIEIIKMGGLMAGFNQTVSIPLEVKCVVLEDEFVFVNNSNLEWARVKRNTIKNVIFEDKSQITTRITATRVLTLGLFALTAPKKETNEDFYLTISYEIDGAETEAMMHFEGFNAKMEATQANSCFRKYIKQPQSDTKKCPYCAETIKREAIFCRFCSKELSQA